MSTRDLLQLLQEMQVAVNLKGGLARLNTAKDLEKLQRRVRDNFSWGLILFIMWMVAYLFAGKWTTLVILAAIAVVAYAVVVLMIVGPPRYRQIRALEDVLRGIDAALIEDKEYVIAVVLSTIRRFDEDVFVAVVAKEKRGASVTMFRRLRKEDLATSLETTLQSVWPATVTVADCTAVTKPGFYNSVASLASAWNEGGLANLCQRTGADYNHARIFFNRAVDAWKYAENKTYVPAGLRR